MPAKTRRTVRLMAGSRDGHRSKPMMWAFDAYSLAHTTGLSIHTVRRAIEKGSLDPTSHQSLALWITKNTQDFPPE